MGQEWRFEKDGNGQWRWVHLEGLKETVSTQTFPDEIHCVVDAMRFVVRRRRAEAERDDPDRAAQAHCGPRPAHSDC